MNGYNGTVLAIPTTTTPTNDSSADSKTNITDNSIETTDQIAFEMNNENRYAEQEEYSTGE